MSCPPSLLPLSSLPPPFRSTLEYIFLELALTQPSLNEAEELAISFDLNIHELYQVVAQTKLERGDGEGALNIYLHSTVSSHMTVRGMWWGAADLKVMWWACDELVTNMQLSYGSMWLLCHT